MKQLKKIKKKIKWIQTTTKNLSHFKAYKKEVNCSLNKFKISYFPPIKNLVIIRNDVKSYNDYAQEQFWNNGYDVITSNLLKSKGEHFNLISGINEIVELLEHQKLFLRKFFSSTVSGSIVLHGVGTGKSLTADVASHYYLSLNPDGHIVFVSPPALILNFINALKQYGLEEKDKDIVFIVLKILEETLI